MAHHEILPHLGAFGADVRVMFFDFSAFNTIQLNMLKNKHTDTGLYSSRFLDYRLADRKAIVCQVG